jgi:hypothetical protein
MPFQPKGGIPNTQAITECIFLSKVLGIPHSASYIRNDNFQRSRKQHILTGAT